MAARARPSLVSVNRILFALVALTGAAALLAPLGVRDAVEAARQDAGVRVPEVADPAIARLEARAPGRNPFDADGARWEAAATGPSDSTEQPDDNGGGPSASGVINLGPIRGVITPDGFVAVGDSFGPGQLQDVQPGRIVITTPDGERVLPLAGSRDQRLDELRKKAE